MLGPAAGSGDTFTVASFTFDDTLGPTTVVPVPPNLISDFESFAFNAQFIPLSNQGNDFDINKSIGIQLLGSIPGKNAGGTSVSLGDTTFQGIIELNWGGSPGVTNHDGDDFVAYENGAPGGPEAYMVAVRETGSQTFSDFRYEFADDSVRVLPSAGTDIAQVLSTGFDLSSFGLANGATIDAIRVANLVPADRVDDVSGQGNVILGGGSGFAPLTGPQGAGGQYNSGGFDADITYIGVIPSPTTETGDFNNDGLLDGADFLVWQRGGSTNMLSQSDLTVWQTNYGSQVPLTVNSVAVPEPTTSLLLLLSITTILSKCQVTKVEKRNCRVRDEDSGNLADEL
ncbi:PEP-CTERM sorting domain-containing protein [Bythopirellula polymerisocia]|nr:PEP-CTERM sorting domain-containing protein [Bythopirellula polymerisocia]